VTTYNEAGEQYEVHVRAKADDRIQRRPSAGCRSARGWVRSRWRTSQGFASGEAPADIRRLSRQRQVTVNVNLLPGTSQASVQDEIDLRDKRLAGPAAHWLSSKFRAAEPVTPL
jgi:multidrug efflux pump subunit AcrB